VLDGVGMERFRVALQAARGVDAGAIAAAHSGHVAALREALHAARRDAVERALAPAAA